MVMHVLLFLLFNKVFHLTKTFLEQLALKYYSVISKMREKMEIYGKKKYMYKCKISLFK